MPDLKYIDAQPEDAALLTATAYTSKKFWGYSDELMELWKEDLSISSEYIVNHKVVKVFEQETFAGFFAIKIEDGNAELDHLWLDPIHIKRNFGRQIFEYLIRYLVSIEIHEMKLIAEPNAKGFYDKMGGKIIGEFQSKISGRMLDIYEFRF